MTLTYVDCLIMKERRWKPIARATIIASPNKAKSIMVGW